MSHYYDGGSLSRREYLRILALGVAQLGIGGSLVSQCFVADVMAQTGNTDGILLLNLDNFPVLKQDFGSILFRVPGLSGFPQVVVTRMPNDIFHAVTSRCTHQGCTVATYRAAAQAIVCSCHGSRFTVDGKVLNGPATSPLAQYPTQYRSNGTLSILIPGLSYRMNIVAVGTGSGTSGRIRLEFPTINGLRYEVLHRLSLNSGEWAPVSFSLTPEGPLDQNQLAGNGNSEAVYVSKGDGNGFYVVSRF